MSGIDDVIRKILERRAEVPNNRSLLVGVSGIDACGKGYLAAQFQAHLALHGVIAAILNVDGWLNLPETRFNQSAPAANFYQNAIRFDQFFAQLVLPLRDRRSVNLVADYVEETASSYRKHTYDFRDVSVVLVEGIFLFKPQYRKHFDLAIWIDCSFSTALARAIDRAQEGLSAANTIAAYETIYFPAQRIHLAQDKPREHADLIFENDTHLTRRISTRPRPIRYPTHLTLN
jgi:uridine kinase